MSKNNGFTLVEILIALFIFAILAVITTVGLHSAINTKQRVEKIDQKLSELQIAQTLLRRDALQAVDRKVIDEDGHFAPAFIMTGSGAMRFTRDGQVNPLGAAQRSNLQRVGYVFRDGELVRLTWVALDRLPETKVEKKVLLKGVTLISMRVLDVNNRAYKLWPPSEGSNLDMNRFQVAMPKAIKLNFKVKNLGEIIDFFPIPSRSVSHDDSN